MEFVHQESGRFVDQIVFIGGKIVEVGLYLDAGGGLVQQVDPVKDTDGLHDHADIVVAVLPSAQNVQPQIDLPISLQAKMLNHGGSPFHCSADSGGCSLWWGRIISLYNKKCSSLLSRLFLKHIILYTVYYIPKYTCMQVFLRIFMEYM